MSFSDWINSSYPNPGIDGQLGWLHITVLIFCIGLIVAFALIFRKRSLKTRKIVLWCLVGTILFFEITRRIINLVKMNGGGNFNDYLYTLLPRPWCAIACWSLIIATVFNKKFLYNFASMTSLLCALVFFAYPGAGFNNQYILFENLYSISTHSLLLVTSISLITLKFTKFEYKNIWKEGICLAVILAYVFLEIYGLKIESDPMYFMPGNDVMDIFGVGYSTYLAIYIIFVIIYFNVFYLIDDRKNVVARFKHKNNVDNDEESRKSYEIIKNVLNNKLT